MAFAMQLGSWRGWKDLLGWLVPRDPAPMTMTALHYGYLPARFAYAGAQHRVQRVECCWEDRARRWFAVRTTCGEHYILVQDLRIGTWQLLA